MLVQKSVPYLSHSLALYPTAAALASTGRRGFLNRRMISNMSASLGGALFNAPPTKVILNLDFTVFVSVCVVGDHPTQWAACCYSAHLHGICHCWGLD